MGQLSLICSGIVIQQDIAEAADEGQRRYEDETAPGKRTVDGLQTAMNSAMETRRLKLTAPFNKYLTIANPVNGKDFLDEVPFEPNLNVGFCFIPFQLINTRE
jgi:hypothetical protein